MATAKLIKMLENEKEAKVDKVKLGIRRIRMIVEAWRNQTKTRIDDCSAALFNQWSKQVTELQLLLVDAENRKKAGDKF